MKDMAAKTHPGFGGPAPYPGSFVHALLQALRAHGWQLDRWQGIAASIRRDGNVAVLEPEIPYRRLRHLPRSRWSEVLSEWLGVLPHTPWPNSEAVGHLRIANPFLRSALGETVAYAVLIPQDLALIATHGDETNRSLLTEQAISRSGRAGADIFEAAVEIVASRTTRESYRAIDEHGILEAAVGDGLDACRVLLLDEYFKDSPDGYFVSLPSRDRSLFLPIFRETLPAAPRLQQMAEEAFRSAVHPISNRLYWVKQGTWGVFDIRREPGRVQIVPPEEFIEVLHRLIPETSGSPPALPSPPPTGSSDGEMPN